MKVLNLIWGFTLGAGIDKCFLTYARLGEIDKDLTIKSVCINLLNLNSHIEPLKELDITFINIKSRSDFSWVKHLKQLLDNEKPDLIFTHGFNGAIMMLIMWIFKSMKIPIICTYHGAYHAPSSIKKFLEPIYNSLSILIYKKLAKKVICVENVSREYLWSKGVPKDRVITVHNGIFDIEKYTPVDLSTYTKRSVPTIVTASRITEVKGLPYLLEALYLLKNRDVQFHYCMIGEGPDLDSLKKQANDLNLNDSISFVGFQDNVPEWLAACDIFTLPSLHEYHSIAVLEAMRAGKAIVATMVGGNGESIKDGVEGILIPSKDVKALANALEKMLTDEEARKQFGIKARKRFVEEFTEEAMMKNLVKALRS